MEQGFNKYAAGNKQYAQGAPNVGKTKTPEAYRKRSIVNAYKAKLPTQSNNVFRDNKSVQMRSALLRKMKLRQKHTSLKSSNNSSNLTGPGGF